MFFTDDLSAGTYELWAVNYAGQHAVTVTIESFGGTGGGSFSDSLPAERLVAGPVHTVSFP